MLHKTILGEIVANQKGLIHLKNIGATIEKKLMKIGVMNLNDLQEMGSVRAYQILQANESEKHLPYCYYLYSLEGAIEGKHWNELSTNERAKLRLKVQNG